MARLEIYIKKENQEFEFSGHQLGSADVFMLCYWRFLEEKYLPSLTIKYPNISWFDFFDKNIYSSRLAHNMTKSLCRNKKVTEIIEKEIWALFNMYHYQDIPISYEETMVLRSTLDNAYLLGSDIPLYVECLKKLDFGENSEGMAKQFNKVINFFETEEFEPTDQIAFISAVSGIPNNEEWWNFMMTRSGFEKCRVNTKNTYNHR